ncbi:MAG: M48 family metalloprotease, partial [Verrucomicrobiota bacterium]|nr:M48 family metalloprotease [Verrucomicrobiota bacterium]
MMDSSSLELTSRLGWAVIHSLWQGGFVAAALAAVLPLVRSAAVRHLACLGALAAMLAGFGVTLAARGNFPGAPPIAAPSQTTPAAAPVAPLDAPPPDFAAADAAEATPPAIVQTSPRIGSRVEAGSIVPAEPSPWREQLRRYAPTVGRVWLGGLALLSLWRVAGWFRVRRLRREGVAGAGLDIQRVADELARRLGLRTATRVLQSSCAAVPMLVGVIKPVILLPARIATGLSPREIEALIAHELAHLARGDAWINLFQLFAETVFFYHPAAWWLARCAAREREHAADDRALQVCEGRAVYASALARIAALDACPAPALAASGGSVLQRIRRILGQPVRQESALAAWTGATTLLAAVLILSRVLPSQAADEFRVINVAAGQSIQQAIDSAPEGAVIRLGEGEWKERIIISKSLTLEGAGWEKTRITIEESSPEELAGARSEVELLSQAAGPSEEKENFVQHIVRPAVWVRGAAGVKLQKLRVQGRSERGPQ